MKDVCNHIDSTERIVASSNECKRFNVGNLKVGNYLLIVKTANNLYSKKVIISGSNED